MLIIHTLAIHLDIIIPDVWICCDRCRHNIIFKCKTLRVLLALIIVKLNSCLPSILTKTHELKKLICFTRILTRCCNTTKVDSCDWMMVFWSIFLTYCRNYIRYDIKVIFLECFCSPCSLICPECFCKECYMAWSSTPCIEVTHPAFHVKCLCLRCDISTLFKFCKLLLTFSPCCKVKLCSVKTELTLNCLLSSNSIVWIKSVVVTTSIISHTIWWLLNCSILDKLNHVIPCPVSWRCFNIKCW